MTSPRIRDAASLIVHRKIDGEHYVLMGQRGAKAAFMPSKFVFPGGAVDDHDTEVPIATPLNKRCEQRLRYNSRDDIARALPITATRELWEETGLVLGTKAEWTPSHQDWVGYAERGYQPSADGFSFVFRAVTPIGPKRRFDARFFLVSADHIKGDPDDFSAASDELSQLQWIELPRVRSFDLPFITEVVLAEVERAIVDGKPPSAIPYFRATDKRNIFTHIPEDRRIS